METTAKSSDAIRARELYKYFRPDPAGSIAGQKRGVIASQTSSPDTALTAYAQLVAWRLNCQRAMISLIDRETQYFVAESTKTLNLYDITKHINPSDALWLGCSSVSKEGRLCERTVSMPPVTEGFPYFQITDLKEDETFCTLPFVSGEPGFRFYAGTPITTNKGINIGSLFVLDVNPRPAFGPAEIEFLGQMAGLVMQHMQLARDAGERQRALRMQKGLSVFVESGSTLERGRASRNNSSLDLTKAGSEQSSKRDVQSLESGMNAIPVTNPDFNKRNGISESGQNVDKKLNGTKVAHAASNEVPESEQTLSKTFHRAANILHESLFEREGGVIFLSIKPGISGEDTYSRSGLEPGDPAMQTSEGAVSVGETFDVTDSAPRSIWDNSGAKDRSTEILGARLPLSPSSKSGRFFIPIGEAMITSLVKRYPGGKLWMVDEDGVASSSEEEATNGSSAPPSEEQLLRKASRKAKENVLLNHFPGVRSLLFVPLWDTKAVRWFSACFCWSLDPTETFSYEAEGLYTVAFGNCVMSEVSRLESMAADQSKTNFIGSISHELRSPLHGILASNEFLEQTNCDPFQQSLVETISACGQTLLDTINHVLDFSKINSLLKSERNARKPKYIKRRGGSAERGLIKSNQGPLNIVAQIDLAKVLEEVVCGIHAGHTFYKMSKEDPDYLLRGGSNAGSQTLKSSGPNLDIILDIQPHDWTFITQPGAFRRICMNLLGNALKYTERGYVKIQMEASKLDDSSGQVEKEMVRLTVSDTGKGISPEYLRTKLFVPFSQENHLAPGTGLGLSIVKTVVQLLEGHIDVKSQVGKGTEFIISLPLSRGTFTNDSPSTTPSSTNSAPAAEATEPDLISALEEDGKAFTFCVPQSTLLTDGFSIQRQGSLLMRDSLLNYLTNWFHLKVISNPSTNTPASIYIFDESMLSSFSNPAMNYMGGGGGGGPALVILCKNGLQYARSRDLFHNGLIIEYLARPFGVQKLAKALLVVISRLKQIPALNAGSAVPPQLMDASNGDLSENVTNVSRKLDEVVLDDCNVRLLDNGVALGREDSINANKALDYHPPEYDDLPENKGQEFPFGDNTSPRPQEPSGRKSGRDHSATAQSLLEDSSLSTQMMPSIPQSVNTDGNTRAGSSDRDELTPTPSTSLRTPRLLLVDDNRINLRLLETFMKKRKYKMVDSAEDGLQAVEAAKKTCYDIIFMDISMPGLNGFEATSQIRELEERRRKAHLQENNNVPPQLPAFIIALTGLASSKDQKEAFQVGIDLFMTKPVSFKEIGKLLDNWEQNR